MSGLTREENIAKHGCNHEKEALGLALAQEAILRDGRLCFRKCAEGALADFCVYLPNGEDKALGVQLKTSHSVCQHRNRFVFHGTSGYDGLLLLMVAFHSDIRRCWTIPGSDVSTTIVGIPLVTPTRKHRNHWQDYERRAEDLPGIMLALLEDPKSVELSSLKRWVVPRSPFSAMEYHALMWLRDRLPYVITEPAVEQQKYDCTVEGRRWQLKKATYHSKGDKFQVNVHHWITGPDGRRERGAYAEDDFDFLVIYMAADQCQPPPRVYCIPMQVLVQRGMIGDGKGGFLLFNPFRTWNGHSAASAGYWIGHYMIDLSSHATAAASYSRLLC